MRTSSPPEYIELPGKSARGLTWLTNLENSIILSRTSPDSAAAILHAAFALHLESIVQGNFPDSA